jgi:hypothetical protein
MHRVAAITVVLLTLSAIEANAQTEAAIGLGLAVTTDEPRGPLGEGATGVGPLLRIKTGTGPGPTIGFGWHTLGVRTMAGDKAVYLGRLRVRPVMVGAAYNWNHGRWWLSASLVGGLAFDRLSVDPAFVPDIRESLGARNVSFDATNSFAYRPELALWYDAAPRVGLMASFGYLRVRPTLIVRSDRGVERRPMDVAGWVLSFGMVYGVF